MSASLNSPASIERAREYADAARGPAERRAAQLARARKTAFAALGGVIALAALGSAAWWYVSGLNYVTTDDAYVEAQVAAITPEVSGTIAQVRVHDTQYVHRGDVLVVLDASDARLALAGASAAYEQAVRRVNGYFASADAAGADVVAKRADVARATLDYQRRRHLFQVNAISSEQLTTARNVLDDANAALKAAQNQLLAQQAMIRGADAGDNPEVLAAKAARDKAALDLSRTTIRAPVDGVVSQRTVQLGQRVTVGDPLMSVVPVGEMYVDANLKESQLARVKSGQRATLTSDLYGSGVVFHGRVEGLGGGTGSAFAVIPAQNATGNWIKVVQRLPVRIALDPKELAQHPLRVGLSMDVSIDVSSR